MPVAKRRRYWPEETCSASGDSFPAAAKTPVLNRQFVRVPDAVRRNPDTVPAALSIVAIALAAVVLGGFGSVPGAILGGLLLGIIEQFSGVYLPDGFKDAMAYLVLIGVLILWPRGLLGEAHGRRV